MTELHIDGPADAAWTLLLAHGAGAGSTSDFMQDMARQLGAAGLRVARFDFPYMIRMQAEGRRRPPDRLPVLQAAYQAAIATLLTRGATPGRLLIGGKSLGGRVASLIADAQQAAGLICLGYPFHPPARPERLRTDHLGALRTPTLICQGERDRFGSRAEVVDYALADGIRLAWLPDGDHSFEPRKASGHTEADNRRQAVRLIMDFVAGLA